MDESEKTQSTDKREPRGERFKEIGGLVAVILRVVAAAVALYATLKGSGPADH